MRTLELLGADYVGFDWMQLMKGATGAIANAGAAMSGTGQPNPAAQQAAIEQARKLEEERRKAEESAARWKTGAVIGGALLGALGLGLAFTRR